MQLRLDLPDSPVQRQSDVEDSLALQVTLDTRPLLKWPGGKREILKTILPLVPRTFNRYYEPFLGGGALFFALQPPESILSDSNAELVNCYIQVRDHPDDVIAHLRRLKNTEEDYYRIRSDMPLDEVGCAARLIYLTTLSFNGIYRLNAHGRFNVPYGHKAHLVPADSERIRVAGTALSSARFTCDDFENAVEGATAGDLVYLDPPYTVAHGSNGCLKYNAKIFSWEDQVRLAKVATALVQRGCRVIVTNADHTSILDLYKGFSRRRVQRFSRIAASSAFRRRTTECIFYDEV